MTFNYRLVCSTAYDNLPWLVDKERVVDVVVCLGSEPDTCSIGEMRHG